MTNRKLFVLVSLALMFAAAAPAVLAQGNARVEDAIWGDGVIWDTRLTPTSFTQPPSHSVDLLYNFGMSGLMGQRAVSSDVPGPGYNGGRWWVQMVVFTESGLAAHDPDGDGVVNFELKSEEDVQFHVELGHIEIFPTSTYFACPLLPSR